MAITTIRSSRPDHWTHPRPHMDPSLRRMKHGAIRPMEEDRSFLARLLGR